MIGSFVWYTDFNSLILYSDSLEGIYTIVLYISISTHISELVDFKSKQCILTYYIFCGDYNLTMIYPYMFFSQA
jgi:hypothetical protein